MIKVINFSINSNNTKMNNNNKIINNKKLIMRIILLEYEWFQ